MPCYHPMPAWRTQAGIVTLREPMDGAALSAGGSVRLSLPCGACLGCRMSRARGWALRCRLELGSHRAACWTTLTYDEDHVPPTLSRSHLSDFVKRFRERVRPAPVRFFASGEYGERTGRPHYHAILFGVPVSAPIQQSWPFGFARVDPLTPAAVAYVAGYCAKKLAHQERSEERVDLETGEVFVYEPPFIQMSRRPGIGAAARNHWRSWRDKAVLDGVAQPVPRYFHERWKEMASPEEVERLRVEREEFAWERSVGSKLRCSRVMLEAQEVNATARLANSHARRKL